MAYMMNPYHGRRDSMGRFLGGKRRSSRGRGRRRSGLGGGGKLFGILPAKIMGINSLLLVALVGVSGWYWMQRSKSTAVRSA